jgi:thiol:disulfide interchange protein
MFWRPSALIRSSALLAVLSLMLSGGAAPAIAAVSEDGPLSWHLPGDEAALAERDGKPILYFVTAEWCGPCRALEEKLFSDPEKAERIESWYVPVVVEDQRADRGSNPPEVAALMERFRVRSIPTLIIVLPDGTPVATQAGYRGADPTWRWLEKYADSAGEPLAK